MYKHLIMTALLGAALLSAPAMAAGEKKAGEDAAMPNTVAIANPAQQCTNLQKQFDTELPKHMKAAKLADAKVLREDGGKLCATGKQPDGIAKLQNALRDLGVKPKS